MLCQEKSGNPGSQWKFIALLCTTPALDWGNSIGQKIKFPHFAKLGEMFSVAKKV
jgi:hypothetical protein